MPPSSPSQPTLAVELLSDAFGRVAESVPAIVSDLQVSELLWRPTGDANSIAWLIWHLARVQDDHCSDIFGHEQVWTSQGWEDRFALPYPSSSIGYGQTSEDVAAFCVVNAQYLTDYYAAVHDMTINGLRTLSAADFDRIIDTHWDPPVTVAVRLVSVVNDITQHVGQAAYIKGLLPG